MVLSATDRSLAKAAGILSRLTPSLHDLMRLEELPRLVRLQIVAMVEQADLLRFHLQQARLEQVIGKGPSRPDRSIAHLAMQATVDSRRGVRPARPKRKRAKSKR